MSSWNLSPSAELDEALTWFRKRLAIPSAELATMQENARRTSFWMAKVRSAQRAKKIQDSLQDALAHGMDFKTWRKHNRNKLIGISNAHLQTTFRNWTQTAYNASRVQFLSNPQVVKRRPYWMFDAVRDGRTTPICVASDRTVLPAKHPWFLRHTPPLHHNCRSSIRGLTEYQAKKIGIRQRGPTVLTKAKAQETGLKPGRVAPASGFGGHVSEGEWEPTTKDLPKGFKKPKRPKAVEG